MVMLVALTSAPTAALADQRSDVLIRLLTTSSEARVRTQAALSLGRTDGGTEVVQVLLRALTDSSSAVRAAAATALGTVGDGSVMSALRRAQQDSDSGVRSAATAAISSLESRSASGSAGASAASATTAPPSSAARYYVGIGMPGTRASRIDDELLRYARGVVVQQVRGVAGTEVAPDGESASSAQSVIRSRRLAGVYIDCSIVSADTTANGTRVAVSIIVGTYPGRDMRAILSGAATVPGASGPEADRAAIEGAIRGALRNLPQAMASAGGGS